ncbi:hypothetical protein GH714_021155 [Hevea brasiliensis]|uniref:Bulb-type lectin domain-containing protein n=1 Tax=Hevea brasiliensis TaxID=3981 RepID=A0A6A6KA87_HEVBR|nr:hypothetical protein GH714_021155 [Hevea brasiliensis]
MEQEIASIQKNGTWVLTDLPKGHKPIGLKWVYRLKKDPDGKIVKHKARLVAKGYVQRQVIDYNEVFAPVARPETIRVLLAIAAQKDWEPIGYEDKKNPYKVLKLHKALYGLRQAPRAWNSKLDGYLKALDFEQCPHEHALYKRKVEEKIMVVGVYVDDLILTGENRNVINKFKLEMQQKFDMTDLGLLSFYLGIEVKQTATSISVCQTGYAKKILEKMGVGECNPCKLPMEPRTKLSKVVEGETLVDTTLYRSIIGSLRYLVNTRPDITFSVGVLSRFMEKPTTTHMATVKQVLRYIKAFQIPKIYLGSSLFPISHSTPWLSPSGRFAFGFYQQGTGFGFAVGIWLVGKQNTTVVWTSNRNDPPVSANSTIVLTEDGKLLLRIGQVGEKLIANNTEAASFASLHNSGNLVL